MRVLGIETSCDETGVAIYDTSYGLVSNQLYSQTSLHVHYGGVVPELASRDHARVVVSIIQNAILSCNLTFKDIDCIAYTAGPGLSGSLIIGATVGCALGYSCQIPVIAIHHIEGHLFAPMLLKNVLKFPFIALVVSGAHTQLIAVDGIGRYKILGRLLDDAVGEVFDKIAQLLGLGYPGGAALSDMARRGMPGRYLFPRPMTACSGLDFSFSGLKTCVANVIAKSPSDDQTRADIARAFEDSVVETLSIKCQRALEQSGYSLLLLAGGVSANKKLRVHLKNIMKMRKGDIIYAQTEFCTDNAAMIAYVGVLRFHLEGCTNNALSIFIKPRWSIEDLSLE